LDGGVDEARGLRLTDIDAAIDRLLRAVAQAGAPAPSEPASDADLEAVRAMVAPLRVPDDLQQLWRRFQEGPRGLVDTRDLLPVELAITYAPYMNQSRALLVIATGGDQHRFIELHGPDSDDGGAIWASGTFEPDMRELAPSLAALIDAIAVAWERGIVRPTDEIRVPMVEWDEEAWERLKAELLPAGRVVGAGPSGWLPRWLAAEGLEPDDVRPQGPTASIGELLAQGGPRDPATIRGRITSVVVTTEASGVSVDDGTGEVLVYIPRDADPFGITRIGDTFEFVVRHFPADLEVEPPFDSAAFHALATAVREA
jgi:hypothetical protein